MTAKQAIAYARRMKKAATAPGLHFGFNDHAKTQEALIALLDHGDRVEIPDLETAIRMVACQMHGQGKFYIEIGVDPKTKEVGWTFEPTEREESKHN